MKIVEFWLKNSPVKYIPISSILYFEIFPKKSDENYFSFEFELINGDKFKINHSADSSYKFKHWLREERGLKSWPFLEYDEKTEEIVKSILNK